MNQPPGTTPLPAHLRPLVIEIPRTWTPEQALAVFELASELRDTVWMLYDCHLQELLRDRRAGHPGDNNNDDTPSEAKF